MPICPAEGCRQPILENQPTIKLSPGTLLRGKKTGTLYHSATFEEDILIHYGCVFRYFHPQADAEMYDLFYDMVQHQIRREEIDDLKETAFAEVARDVQHICPECRDDRLKSPDDPPASIEDYSCSGCGSAALPVCPDCMEVTDLAIQDLIEASE